MTRTLLALLIALAASAFSQQKDALGIIDMMQAPERISVFTQPEPNSAKRQISWRQDAAVVEHGYEEEGLLVLERKPGWFRVQLKTGSAWLPLPARSRFLDRPALFKERLTFLTKDWDGRLARTPAGTPGPRLRTEAEPSIRVLGHMQVGEILWMRVAVYNASPCEEAEPRVISTGWVPATVIWFYSRGC